MSSTRTTIHSTSSAGRTVAATGRGAVVVLTAETETGAVRFVSGGKRRAAKQPFSRLSDGQRHEVTVRKVGEER